MQLITGALVREFGALWRRISAPEEAELRGAAGSVLEPAG
jgi:hypothetical protein